MSLSELAERATISKGYVWQLEKGEQPNPSFDILEKIAKALDTTVGEILGEKVVGKAPKLPDEIPEQLQKFIESQRQIGNTISDDDVALLCQIQFRTRKPIEASQWEYLYQSIKLITSSRTKMHQK